MAELDRIADTTTFNNKKILDGSAGIMSFQVGANANQTIAVEMVNVKSNALGSQAGITQTTTGRIAIMDDGADFGTLGIGEQISNVTLDQTEFCITIDGKSAVHIADATYGGWISRESTTDLTDVNSSKYGSGMAKAAANRINAIREMELEDTAAGMEGTYFEDVYASAKTTFKISDITDANSYTLGGTIYDSDYTYVGAGSLTNGQLQINGVDIGAVSFEKMDADGALTDAINAKSSITGVDAEINDAGELVLTAEDGRDIIINTAASDVANTLFAAGGTSTNPGQSQGIDGNFDNLRIHGKVTITAGDTITLTDTSFEAGVYTLTEDNVQAVGTIANADVTTVEGANTLIDSVDSALKQVDNMRAKLGAIQNRFESTINNLTSISENVSASRSRTLDADFASETANLTKAQILQQAGVAMLSQSNQLPQAALTLLQG